ncbi:MAG: EmrB/QacA family drug resistance transporter [Oceanospirillaceae bacterium]|uniref:DHA2 family efflux MFS transporter permease subunit n=1 Tax=unclassified Thalassolituus TaxID=2624967 RepID=UPI000C5EAFC7|nr:MULTISPECIES: DHA2 family efflux MFS transporter permease subunit [unclassified Thalassolituus]MAS25252.1 EmrB/QacA family drug resistance transporter [Oceanospirillaceae bacterium]MAX98198.1 EmrB/QacA family drug resistance transporter [Oceanospirillaceae bacterium]MBL33974.1 EmrB/QacA family drug resistance transporter [Oceanospirillaceae bacterium]MBS54225.1 EmrB/QacA family drug resistance transporter [Oceanospirillaceae bacterium]|tara:strand:- start:5688 stop:7241 length:1554 start_codon:yes stop_codon:yes gene_type:complete
MSRGDVPVKHWLAIGGALLGSFMAILDIQITNSSLKDIQAALGATLEESSWIATSYLVAEMIAIPLTGFFAAWLSPRRYLLWNTTGFIISSLLCSFAWNLESMIVFRAMQGFTGGALIPMAFTLILQLLPLEKRPLGMALFGVTATFAPSIGPTLGGWLTEAFSWHYIFYLNVIPGVVVLWLLAEGLDKQPGDYEQLKRIDVFGMVTMALGLGCLQVMLEEGSKDDWFDAEYIRWLAVISAVSLVLFVRKQLTTQYPLVNLRLFYSRDFSLSCVTYVALGAGLFGSVYLVPLYLASVHDYTALDIGLVLMWVGFPQLPFFPLIPRIMQKIEAKYLVAFGFAVMGGSMFMNIHMTTEYTGAYLIPALLVRALGQPFIMVALSVMSAQNLKPEDTASASTLFNVMRNLGGAVGIAVLATLLSDRTDFHLLQIQQSVVSGTQAAAEYMHNMGMMLGIHGGPEEQKYGMLMEEMTKQAMVMSYNEAFFALGSMMLIAALASLAIRSAPVGQDGQGAPAGAH